MTSPATGLVPATGLRVVDRARQVRGYTFALRSGALGPQAHAMEDGDLTYLTAGQPLHVYVDPAQLDEADGWPADLVTAMGDWRWPRQLVFVLPADRVDPATAQAVAADRDPAPRLALDRFDASPAQMALLRHLDHVVVDAAHPHLAELVAAAHTTGTTVVAARALTAETWKRAFDVGADLVSSALAPRDALRAPGNFSAGELHAMEMVQLLDAPEPDMAAVTGVVAADPALSVSVLRLINSPAMGLRRQVDSVRHAVVLAGPRHLHAIAVRSLITSSKSPADDLWAMLTRAMVVWDLADDEAGYTAGMLSALADLRRFPPRWLAAQAKLSDAVVAAMVDWAGPIGTAIADLVAYELGDTPTTHDPVVIADARRAAAYDALGVARALAQ